MTFRLDTPFYQIPGLRPRATFGAMMEMLLKTRLKLRLDTNREGYDEDVNTYLAGLLVSYIDPVYLTGISKVLSHYDIDVYEAVNRAKDQVRIYWIYKVNADDLLMTLGIFRELWEEANEEVARLKQYYSLASGYQRRIYRKPTAVGDVQSKLADATERYLRILSLARSDYLHLLESIKPEELAAFQKEISTLEKELPLKARWDEFLDAYAAWVKEPKDPLLRERFAKLLSELKSLDPSFQPGSLDWLR